MVHVEEGAAEITSNKEVAVILLVVVTCAVWLDMQVAVPVQLCMCTPAALHTSMPVSVLLLPRSDTAVCDAADQAVHHLCEEPVDHSGCRLRARASASGEGSAAGEAESRPQRPTLPFAGAASGAAKDAGKPKVVSDWAPLPWQSRWTWSSAKKTYLPTQVFLAPSGRVYHTRQDCQHLDFAAHLTVYRLCKTCCVKDQGW